MDYKRTTQKSYENTADEYAQKVAHLTPFKEIEKFISLLSPNAKILDIGCGSGRDAQVFTEKGFAVVGIDFCLQLIEIAKKTAPHAEFQVMDIEAISLPKSSFHGIWASASLLHIPKERISSIFKKFHFLLHKEGIFYLSVKRGSGEGVEKDSRYDDVEKFWSYFEEAEMKNYLEKAKFEILDLFIAEKEDSYQTHSFLKILAKKA